MAETGHPAEVYDRDRRLSNEAPHGLGETEEQHAHHDEVPHADHFGLSIRNETILFYVFTVPAWCLEIAAAVCGAYYHTWKAPFIATMSAFMILHAAAWLQTAVGMIQRASWVRDEGDLVDRRQFLYLAVRLNRLMFPTAVIGLATFIQAYARRGALKDLAYWLLFLLVFIWNVVGCVMNAYNNITWESDRLMYEEGEQPFRLTRLAILGLPSTPKELPKEA
ncbi:hypothetical protein LTR36_003694 [Oleoguttula mirabilis]|uniref:Uncharacterized protein n=1 Tax=Oleoguttula mirabilis TaxID=1507867 RepID=A0AAV9JJH8_9PEZI|nr:hypothetical protein LTR36_003694 [Oleoguttula mirabilis]